MLTPVRLAFEYADVIERTGNNRPQAPEKTRSLLLERIIEPLLQNTEFEVFRPSIERARYLLCSGHLVNVRELEVMLLAQSYVSAPLVGDQNSIALMKHRNIVSLKICIQTITGK